MTLLCKSVKKIKIFFCQLAFRLILTYFADTIPIMLKNYNFMKQILLTFFFSMFLTVGFSQSFDCQNCFGTPDKTYSASNHQIAYAAKQLMVYPNPATNFIMLKNSTGVKEVRIFNLIGRQVANFTDIEKGQSYPVANLPNGMYLVQLIDASNDIMSTHRMNKR